MMDVKVKCAAPERSRLPGGGKHRLAACPWRAREPAHTGGRILLAFFFALCWHVQARGALPDEVQVYTDDLQRPGEFGVQLHVNTTPSGRGTPDYPGEVVPRHGLRVTPELSWGLIPGWDAGLYLPFVRSEQGADHFAGVKFRLKWVPLRPREGEVGCFAGVNAELSLVARRFEEARRTGEIRPIIGLRDAKWLLSFNPIIRSDLRGPQQGVLTFAPALKVARAVGNGDALGIEYYAELGRLAHFAPRGEQAHSLFLTLDTARVNFGIGRGFSGAADRWTLKAIISF